jgi:hypothetical protein
MVEIAASTEAQRARRKRQQRPWDIVLVGLVLAAAVVALVSFLTPQSSKANSAVHNSVRRMNKPRPVVVEVDDLEHEGAFRKAVTKSCLPAKNTKCGVFIPDPIIDTSQSKVQRVALLAPPGHLSGSLVNRIEKIVSDHNNLPDVVKIQLIQTTHVPPYGYGKSHGYTKLIRLIPEPLLLEVADALSGVLRPGESHTAFTVADVKAALRMMLRFHCRLSHVAAHTALLSVKFMDLFADPMGTTRAIRDFLSPTLGEQRTKQDRSEENGKATDDQDVDAEVAIDDDQASLMDAELAYGSQLLTHIQLHGLDGGRNRTVGRGILDILDHVLLEEFQMTKDLTVWPCPSFWSSNDNGEPLSELARRLAQKLSPNCDDPYNSCFVPRDQCEFQGDALCIEQQKQKS